MRIPVILIEIKYEVKNDKIKTFLVLTFFLQYNSFKILIIKYVHITHNDKNGISLVLNN